MNEKTMSLLENSTGMQVRYRTDSEQKTDGTIRDEKLIDALNLYTAILRNTKEIFGEENLTEAVMVKLLETASYGVWRSIMGPKGEKDTTSPSRKYERI